MLLKTIFQNISGKRWFGHHVVLSCSFIRSLIVARTLAPISWCSLLWISLPSKHPSEKTKWFFVPEGPQPSRTRWQCPDIVLLLSFLLKCSIMLGRMEGRTQTHLLPADFFIFRADSRAGMTGRPMATFPLLGVLTWAGDKSSLWQPVTGSFNAAYLWELVKGWTQCQRINFVIPPPLSLQRKIHRRKKVKPWIKSFSWIVLNINMKIYFPLSAAPFSPLSKGWYLGSNN